MTPPIGYGSKSDLEQEIERLETELSDAHDTLATLHQLLKQVFVGERGTLIRPDVWKEITEVIE